jgi:hypothetical protein
MSLKRKPPAGNVRRTICLGNNFRGVTTNKRGHLVQFESEQERKLILLLERDPSVTDYISQPETLFFKDEKGRSRRYTPDFQVWRTQGTIELHEVTIESRRESRASLHEREAAAKRICQERGWNYIIHTDETLPIGYEYANLDFLSAFRPLVYDNSQMADWWVERLKGQTASHPGILVSTAEPDLETGALLNNLYHLLWYGVIAMPWRQPFFWRGDFHPQACIWLPEE